MTNLKEESGVYCIENTITGKKYIGESGNILYRYRKHRNDLKKGKHCNPQLQKDVDFYGLNKFKIYTLITCPKKDRLRLEKEYISKLELKYNSSQEDVLINGLSRKENFRQTVLRNWEDPDYRQSVIEYRSKAVEKLDLKTGKVLAEYPSAKVAGRETNIHLDSIGHNCRGAVAITGGFRWRFKGEQEIGFSNKVKKAVIAKDIRTLEVVYEFSSLTEASKEINYHRKTISKWIRGISMCSIGLIWEFKTINV